MKYLLVLLFCVLPTFCSPTVVVLIISDNSIIVAADSQETTIGYKPIKHCKLHIENNVVYTAINFVKRGNYDLFKIVQNRISKTKLNDTLVYNLANEIKDSLNNIIQEMITNNNEDYNSINHKNFIVKLIMVGSIDKIPTAYEITFTQKENDSIIPHTSKYECTNAFDRRPQAWGITDNNELDILYKDFYKKVPDEDFAVKIIQKEIDLHPDSISHPINVIKITSNKITWINDSGYNALK